MCGKISPNQHKANPNWNQCFGRDSKHRPLTQIREWEGPVKRNLGGLDQAGFLALGHCRPLPSHPWGQWIGGWLPNLQWRDRAGFAPVFPITSRLFRKHLNDSSFETKLVPLYCTSSRQARQKNV